MEAVDPIITNKLKTYIYKIMDEFVKETEMSMICVVQKLNSYNFGLILSKVGLLMSNVDYFYKVVLKNSIDLYNYKKFGTDVNLEDYSEYMNEVSMMNLTTENEDVACDFIAQYLNEHKDEFKVITKYLDSSNYKDYRKPPYYIFTVNNNETGNIAVIYDAALSKYKYIELDDPNTHEYIPITIFCENMNLLDDMTSNKVIDKLIDNFCIKGNIKIHIASIRTEMFKIIYDELPSSNDLISRALIIYAVNKAILKLAKKSNIIKPKAEENYNYYMNTPFIKSNEYNYYDDEDDEE